MPMLRPFTRLDHPRELIRQFTPNWFTSTMGTGILALALNMVPLQIPGIHRLAELLWMVNIGLFAICTVMYSARWIFFFDTAQNIFKHSIMSMFLGAIPMGLATIINGFLAFGTARWGEQAVSIAHTLWWIDAAMAMACAWLVPFLMFTTQNHKLEKMTAVWLLPMVAAEVTAASGGLLLQHLPVTSESLTILYFSYALWAISVLPAMGVLVILFLRMTLHKLPGPDMAVSCWLSLGPIGTGTLGLLLLGEDASRMLSGTSNSFIGQAAHGMGVVGGAIFWGYGVYWLVMAVLITCRYLRDGLPFNMGWWGFTFPLGVYAVATLTLGRITGVGFYGAIGSVLVVALVGFWILVTSRTLHGAYHGYLFVSPCLSQETGLTELRAKEVLNDQTDLTSVV